MIITSLATHADGIEKFPIGFLEFMEGEVVTPTVDVDLRVVMVLLGQFQQDGVGLFSFAHLSIE
jgi:hypothetical protein